MIIIKKDINLGKNAQSILSEIFVNSYYDELKGISKDRNRLCKVFEHTFVLGNSYVALINDKAVVFISCTNGYKRSMIIDKKVFRKEFGLIKGSIVSRILNQNFTKKSLKQGYKICFIDNVATSPSHQGMGVATSLINYILNIPKYSSYVLEVADNNTSAVTLYKKLGFNEFTRVKYKGSKKHGIDYLLWMVKNDL